MNALVFQNTTFDVVDQAGQVWLKAADIARALGYKKADAVAQIYERNSDEFTPAMTLTLNLSVKGFGSGESVKEVRIFSLRGAHLIAMFARTVVAKAFRRWVLDVLDSLSRRTTTDDRTPLRDAVNMLVSKRRLLYPDAYAIVHQRFNVAHIDELTAEQVPQAIEYVQRMALEGEWLPARKTNNVVLDEREAYAVYSLMEVVKHQLARERYEPIYEALRALKSPYAARLHDMCAETKLSLWPLEGLKKRCKPQHDALQKKLAAVA
ncbi:BRO-N domain-containing protein [Chitiniphilus shinanonensis]|uniref:BRO-N domain-containing protein n=1 Tax=Chitiniphilus shinanonensis TaxID=553088 RepID=UPI003043F8AC